ncbi:unnamed protein product [Bursaphelenchus okinawaensis]|uniref:ZP domain-containing protein n=1 Tax=Bursaphelenchus okinawaensis TaxID=465554 RepID=A0A811KH68_9BILA|nr:unnamed protein product [Bursaphelenchus okinawaensis]CAG9104442.1 unnamed protein product [Bursaphelenchus okinawaensis]
MNCCLFFFLSPFLFIQIASIKCTDGLHNVISLHTLPTADSVIQVNDLKVATYDKMRIPSCKNGKPELSFPGFLKIIDGEITVKDDITIDFPILSLSAEHNSFFIGEVCKDGKSENPFVDDEYWYVV